MWSWWYLRLWLSAVVCLPFPAPHCVVPSHAKQVLMNTVYRALLLTDPAVKIRKSVSFTPRSHAPEPDTALTLPKGAFPPRSSFQLDEPPSSSMRVVYMLPCGSRRGSSMWTLHLGHFFFKNATSEECRINMCIVYATSTPSLCSPGWCMNSAWTLEVLRAWWRGLSSCQL